MKPNTSKHHDETEYLLASPKNAAHLKQSITEYHASRTKDEINLGVVSKDDYEEVVKLIARDIDIPAPIIWQIIRAVTTLPK